MTALSIFCGSSQTIDAIYVEATKELCRTLKHHDIDIVYGGANCGLMKELADAHLSLSGKVIGVMPHFLVERERAHHNLSEMHLVETLHERKAKMNQLSDGALLLPGGAGSLDEFFDLFTLFQLGEYDKPLGLLNTNQYFDGFIVFMQHSVAEGFVSQTHFDRLIIEESPEVLVDRLFKT